MRLFLNRKTLVVLLIFILALSIRIYSLNWDQGYHLHPDERFLTMFGSDIKLPSTLTQYFDTVTSPLNPYNYKAYQFFVYGTLPVFLTKFLAVILHLDGYDHIYLLGRFLSALFDASNVILLYYLSRRKIFPSLFYALTILPIQLSHFWTVDTFLSTFILATFTLLSYNLFLPAAITFALALSCKLSSILFIPVIGIFIIKQKNILSIVQISFIFLLLSFITFRLVSPYTFTGLFQINHWFINSLKTLQTFSDPNGWFPPSVQWLSQTPVIFSLKNLVLYGLGIPLTLTFLWTNLKNKLDFIGWISLFWIFLVLIFQGLQLAQTMRYFLPIYPFIILIGCHSLSRRWFKILFVCQSIIVLAFLNIYSHPHSRVDASAWIYQHIPSGSTLTNEYWDDPLPLYLPEHNPAQYKGIMISPYDPDTSLKWQTLNQQLSEANYLIMSSNRLWGSIPRVPSRYPLTAKFYQDLFAEKLDFKKLVEIDSYPGFSLPFFDKCYYLGPTNFPGVKNPWISVSNQCLYPGIYFRDDTAEEAFTVYDHPKVLIFSRPN